jgi:hypothetical protein
LSCDPAADPSTTGEGAVESGEEEDDDDGEGEGDGEDDGEDDGEAVTGTGVASDRKSQPHDSQNRPVRGAEHAGQGSPAPSAPAGAGVAEEGDDEAGVADAIGGAPIRAPHSSQ